MRYAHRRPLFVLALIVPLAGFASLEALFAPSAELWPKWQSHDAASKARIDHRSWGAFLRKYVSTDATGLNRVAYGKVSDADTKALHAYLETLRKVPVSTLNRDEQMAYWVNLYNALTVRLIVQFYPVKSIRDIDLSDSLFGGGPWDKKLIRVEGEMISLNDIEHRILRPIWKDPRIHYAVNCASVGCPNLSKTPYTGRDIDEQLRAAAKAFVNNPRGVRVGENGLVLSKIYAWFADDFGGGEAGVLDHLATHASSNTEIKIMQAVDVDAYEYDWSLNDAGQ
ncbi:MAG: DUF547 domain-containing protein [Magnetovibrio sp.]|nr:DUF547 domain-containing protein [Magnetovibrio sp.]